MRCISCLICGPNNVFGRISAQLLSLGSIAIRTTPCAIDSGTLWYAIALCFFLNVDSGWELFITTLLLSQYIFVGPSSGIPNIRSLYLNASTNSTAILAAIKSKPKVEDSTVFCHFENQRIGAVLQKIMIPVWERCVTRLPA
jgi:hypothetical protein